MFDYVRCEAPLPDGFDGGEFQTKNLGCDLERYRITRDGRLVLESDIEGVVQDVNYTGTLNFYMSERPRTGGAEKWHEYNAELVDGRLISINLSPDSD